MIYLYKTGIGAFSIQPDPNEPGRWRLYIDDLWLGSYASPEQAADDVYMCATGFYEWDRQLTVDHPEDLGEWVASRPQR
jgi:hypothetical protein